jgi:hypothetical protein
MVGIGRGGEKIGRKKQRRLIDVLFGAELWSTNQKEAKNEMG